jgi:hypothetical protein
MKLIYATSGKLEGNCYPLKNGVTIGRAVDNDITINDSYVSKLHTTFFDHKGDLYIIDNNSHNGLFINNIRYRLKRLHPSDRVKIGKNVFIYFEGEEDIFQRKYNLFSYVDKDSVRVTLLKEAEQHEDYLQIFYRVLSPYLQFNDGEKFWKNLKNIVYRFNIENFLLAEIGKNNKLRRTDISTSFYDKIPEIDEKTLTLLDEGNIVTLYRSVKSLNLQEYLVMYPLKRKDKFFVWILGRFVQREIKKEELNQLYFTGLILSFLK